MKNIKKTAAPAGFITWCLATKASGVNYNYSSLPNPEKGDLHNALTIEQGEICGYSMKRISKTTSHIEHIKPQHECIKYCDEKDLDYNNVLSCYPKPGKGKCVFGAEQKSSWWNIGLFISPINDSCELKFIYNLKGEINPCGCSIAASQKTIDVLKLDEPSLTFDRKKAIEEFLYGHDGASPLSCVDAKRAIDAIYKPNMSGVLYEYCIAIHDALFEYLDILKKVVPNPSLC